MKRVHIHPALPDGPDLGDGGIRQVIKGQVATLPEFGWEYEPDPGAADVIACHIEIPPQFLRLYPDKPIVAHNHGLYWHPDYSWGEAWTYRANRAAIEAIRNADATTAVSDWTAQTLRRHSNRDIRVVTHGVNLDEWGPPAAGPRGYVLWNKTRVDPICDPAPVAELAQRMPDVPFITTFYPGGPEGAPENVTVTDKLPYEEAKRYVQLAGVYLCTTRETFGIGTLEAMACGVPVVGFDWGGQAEFIEHGLDGWLVRPGDYDGLAEGIRWALAQRADAGEAAREKAERFPVANASREYARIYDEVLARHQRQGPKVSVIVPVYNMGDYLADALQSVANQTMDDWECIIVNDASPDERDREIAQRFTQQDRRFQHIIKERNEYLAAARNTGIEASSGKYILPLDADDMLHPQALELLSTALDGNRAIHTAYGGVYFVEEDGRTPHDYKHQRGPGWSGWPVDFTLSMLFEHTGQPGPYSSMYRREVWELTGGYRTRCRTSEDQDFWLRTASYGFVPKMVTEAPVLTYRLRENSMSGQQGWANHRDWYPWVKQRSSLPAAAYRGDVANHLIDVPALDPAVISVIIPVGPGHGKYVVDAVDSVDAQTFRLWECIVINDSGQPLPRLPQWVRVVEPPGGRFGGVAAARNAGIAASRAPLFLPLDADDYLQPQALEVMLAAHIDALPDRLTVYSDFFEDPHEAGKFTVWQTPDFDAHRLHTKGLYHAVTALTPRSYWAEVGGYDESLPGWEDWAFALSLAGKGHCSRRVAAPLFTYRKHTGARARENMADFDTAKAAMEQKDFNAGSDGELMACGACRNRATVQTYGGGPAAGPALSELSDDMVMLEYLGTRAGKHTVRGVAGPNGERPLEYRVTSIRPRFLVMRRDLQVFMNQTGQYRIAASPAEVTRVPSTPVLVAAGAPAVAGAAPVLAGEPGVTAPQAPAPEPPATAASPEQEYAAIQSEPTATPPPAATAAPAQAPAPVEPTPAPAPQPAPAVAPPVEPPAMYAAAASEPAASEPAIPEGWVDEPAMQAMTRTVLNAYAQSRGITNPEALKSKGDVIHALVEYRQMLGQ